MSQNDWDLEVVGALNGEVLHQSFIVSWLVHHRPHVLPLRPSEKGDGIVWIARVANIRVRVTETLDRLVALGNIGQLDSGEYHLKEITA
jgi:hypothetical protein